MIQLLADIIAFILNFLRPVVSPLGEFMVAWMEIVLQFFPTGSLVFYITFFIIIVLLGVIVNTIWPGDRPPRYITKSIKKEKEIEEKKKIKKPKHIKKKEKVKEL